MDHNSPGLFTTEDTANQAMFLLSNGDAAGSLWVRPVLLSAVSADGTDYIEVDARKYLDKVARTEPLRISLLCSTWFTCDSDSTSAYLYRQVLREVDTDAHLFLIRMEAHGKGWTCSLDRKAAKAWIMNTQPNQRIFLDPLMVEG